jgi:mucin type N-acetylglucosaminyltransferase 3
LIDVIILIPALEELLRAIYEPQNYYCIHVDAKSNQVFKDQVEKICSCFPNVFESDRNVEVTYLSWSIAEVN